MELRQLKQLLVLAETLNFHRAAEKLHIAQPALSRSIRKLEEELGVELFERHPTGLRMTYAGAVVLRKAQRTLSCADEVRQAALDGQSGEQGVLRLGYVGSATYSLMPRLIRAFRLRYPRVETVIEESATTDLLKRLETYSLDVALVRYPTPEAPGVTLTLLSEDSFYLAVCADSAFATRPAISLKELADAPFILQSRTLAPASNAILMGALNDAGIQPHIVQEAVQLQSVLSLVECGLGVALVPGQVRAYLSPGVSLVPISDWPVHRKAGIALAAMADVDSATALNFIALAQATVKGESSA